ncbi:coniferyl aldehyde dehydrogenase [Rhodococcus erythropolis]|jgi:coniferyl-aldehyde dehydrogenase|uniref:coniferyl aldehyde dehydrogenase n=1 Tax=Rhodococcus TaxID=1827 RepID=UPI000407355C|nr:MULTISPECIES: coniferyl aldehyde dehydrogenase [Rhodococcus]MDJ0404097.1 coniferyl aldehyde dehydrogenase [Rhodococcus erythropolis]NRH32121.1 coniferyl aldehyde dehydrogenase [Rhodococcus sp. MS13]OXM21438.1 coniferyl aldehyde dehydrogenase [Rhodococcus erythropolis]
MSTDAAVTTDLEEILRAQQEATRAAGLPSAQTRRERIQRVVDLLVANHKDLTEAINEDFGGRIPAYSVMNDVLGSMVSLKHVRDSLEEWMIRSPRATGAMQDQLGATAYVSYQPKGSIGIIGTWNAPLFTLLSPLACALGAGNRAVLKPSEIVPNTAAVLAEAARRTLDPVEVAVVTGGPEVADLLTSLPFDHLVFTGSTTVGKLVMANAAKNLVPVTLELGGKSPSVLSRSADISSAASRLAIAKSTNAGQLCVSPDLIYVPRENTEAFIDAFTDQFTGLFPTIADNKDMVSIVSDRHLARIEGYIADAEERGARIITVPDEELSADTRRRPLRIVVDPPTDAQIMKEEIFGPAVVILPYDQLDSVVADINSRPKPLALYYFGTDLDEKESVLERTVSGGVTINDAMAHPGLSDAPFGGVGASGIGHYHGREGFLEFSHARTVFEAAQHDPRGEWGMLPPYGEGFEQMMLAQVTP